MWFKKNKDEAFEKILKLLQLLEAKVMKNEMEIDLIKLKAKKKIFKEAGEEEVKKESVKYDDGFDELRDLNKNG